MIKETEKKRQYQKGRLKGEKLMAKEKEDGGKQRECVSERKDIGKCC